MDLFALFQKTYKTLKTNLLLFISPLIMMYLVPVALGIVGVYVFVATTAFASLMRSMQMLVVGDVIVRILVLAVIALAVYSTVFAGWGNMNQSALTRGKTGFDDFTKGFKKYFGRVFAAVAITAIVLLIIGLAAAGSVFMVLGRTIRYPTLRQLLPLLLRATSSGSGILPANPFPLITGLSKFVSSAGPLILFFATLAGAWMLLTLFWVPSIIVSDMSLHRAFSNSISFVRENFYTVIGYAGLFIIASRLLATILPGGRGVGRGFVFVMPAGLSGIFQVLLQAFFVLLLYAIYIDRKH